MQTSVPALPSPYVWMRYRYLALLSVVTSKRRQIPQQPAQRYRSAYFGFPSSPEEMLVGQLAAEEAFCANALASRTPWDHSRRCCVARTYASRYLHVKAPLWLHAGSSSFTLPRCCL